MWRRGVGMVAITCLLSASSAAAADPNFPPPGPKVTAPGRRSCGHINRFGHRFPIEADGITCGEARRLVKRRCGIRVRRQWSCFSFREDEPFIVWFPSEDLFKRRLYPVALLWRYPCSEAKVTPTAFAEATGRFPTRRQLLADDVLRCHLLGRGDDDVEVEQMLGPPDEREPERGSILFVYFLGPERDSYIQIDPELLLIELSHGKVVNVDIVQG